MSNFICEISSIPQEIALIGSLDKSLCRVIGEVVPMQNILLDLWGDDDFFNVRGTGYKLIVE